MIDAVTLALGGALAAVGGPACDGLDCRVQVDAQRRIKASENTFNLRVGGSSSSSNGRPTFCGEGTLWGLVSLEGCGTFTGVLHNDPGPEVSHYRVKLNAFERYVDGGRMRLQIGAGFAELQVGEDRAGFDFGAPDGSVETAGPEAVVSGQWIQPFWYRWDLVLGLNTGVAWFEYAPRLDGSLERDHLFFDLTLGVGW